MSLSDAFTAICSPQYAAHRLPAHTVASAGRGGHRGLAGGAGGEAPGEPKDAEMRSSAAPGQWSSASVTSTDLAPGGAKTWKGRCM